MYAVGIGSSQWMMKTQSSWHLTLPGVNIDLQGSPFISHWPRKSPKGDEQTLWGGPVEIMVEDFLIQVHGEDQTDDDCKLWRVLDRSREAELKFNPKKEKLWVSEISYDGLVFSADGLNQTLKSKHSVSDKVCLKYLGQSITSTSSLNKS